MNVSDRGLAFIAKWEGVVNRLYNDDWKPLATSKGNCTIGVGHLVHLGPCTYADPAEFQFFGGVTDAQAVELMRQDVPRYEAVVDSHARVPLTQNQYDALVDFCFNTGGGYPAVWGAVNTSGDVGAVLVRTAILPAWATDALVLRRQAEADLFNEPVEEEPDMKPVLVWCIDLAQTWVWGPFGAAPILYPVDAAAIEKLYGPHALALHESTLRALGGK